MKIFCAVFLFLQLCYCCNAFSMRPIDEPEKLDRETREVKNEVHERTRRSFLSYYYNYYDEMAMSICASIPGSVGHIFPVRRTCISGSKTTCSAICTDPKLKKQRPNFIGSSTKWSCIESLHVYKRRPALANNHMSYTDSSKIGLVVYRYHSCSSTSCGPNYCCCRAYY